MKAGHGNSVYIDTIISPSYTSALAQAIQLPGISGMENNMVVFEYDKQQPGELKEFVDNFGLILAGNLDVCVLGSSDRKFSKNQPIHVWIRSFDHENSNLMILLSYIIMGHPDWQKSEIKIFDICKDHELEKNRKNLIELVKTGRIPITPKNIEVIQKNEAISSKKIINERSKEAGLTIIGIRPEHLELYGINLFKGYDEIGEVWCSLMPMRQKKLNKSKIKKASFEAFFYSYFSDSAGLLRAAFIDINATVKMAITRAITIPKINIHQAISIWYTKLSSHFFIEK